ncbi:MAG: MFS transporter, partial [Alphaproteobacteria bacterium]
MIALIGWSSLYPSTDIWMVMGLGLVIATASASQDITIDALRIEQIGADEKSSMAAGAATAVVGWWSGYKIGGMLMLFIADWLEQAGHTNYWQLTFLYLCGFVCLANIGLMLIPEASASSRIAAQKQAASGLAAHFGTSRLAAVGGFLVNTVWGPLGSFFRKNGLSVALTLLGFIFLFK